MRLHPRSSWTATLAFPLLLAVVAGGIGCASKAVRLNDEGVAQLGREDLAGAEKSFHASLDADPSHGLALYNLGFVHELRGEYRRARDWYRKAAASPADQVMKCADGTECPVAVAAEQKLTYIERVIAIEDGR